MAIHKVAVAKYWMVFAVLVVLTILTVGASRLPISEPWHTLLALVIATIKGGFVLLIFMHVLYSTRLTWIVALGGIVWLVILFGFTFSDYVSRKWDTWQPLEQVQR